MRPACNVPVACHICPEQPSCSPVHVHLCTVRSLMAPSPLQEGTTLPCSLSVHACHRPALRPLCAPTSGTSSLRLLYAKLYDCVGHAQPPPPLALWLVSAISFHLLPQNASCCSPPSHSSAPHPPMMRPSGPPTMAHPCGTTTPPSLVCVCVWLLADLMLSQPVP